MTAQDLIDKTEKVFFQELHDSTGTAIEVDDVKELMIKFAQFHVEKALEIALDEVPYGGSDPITFEDVKNIKNCYPLENIK